MGSVRLPLPAFLPDQSSNSGVLLEATGVFAAADGYRPIKEFQPISDALADSFKGGASFVSDDGNSYLLVGTDAGLVRYSAGAWSDLVTGMTVSEQWRFASFGNYAIAVNGAETKVVALSAGTASALTDAPAGKSIAIVGDYVVIGQADGDLLGVYTSKVNDHTGWDVLDGATVQPMLAGGEVMGLAGGEYGVILQRRRIVRMSLTGDGIAPFSYDVVQEDIGCASKASVVSYGRSVFFLSDSGFMALEHGQELRPIGSEKIDRTFQAAVPPEDYERLFSAIDPQRKIVMWCVPGTPGKLWIYNYELDRWTTDTIRIDGVFNGFTSSTSLEEIDTLYPSGSDSVPYSLDDPRFKGGAPQFYVVQDGAAGSLSGDNRKAVWQWGHNEPVSGRVSRFRAIRPVSDGIEGDSITLDVRARQGDEANTKACGAMRTSGIMPVRASGRYVKPRWEKAAGSDWSYAQGLEIEIEAGGGR